MGRRLLFPNGSNTPFPSRALRAAKREEKVVDGLAGAFPSEPGETFRLACVG